MKLKPIKNELLLREEYENYVEKEKQAAITNSFMDALLQDIKGEEDAKLLNTEENDKKILNNALNNALTAESKILSFEEWLKIQK